MKLIIPLNNNLNFIFIKKNVHKFILIFNKNKNIYIKYKINNFSKIYFLKNLNCISIQFKHFTNNLNKNSSIILNKQVKSIDFYFFKKIQFFGKGFKIKKLKKQILNMFFNKSHITFLKWNNIFLKKIKKTKIIIYSTNYYNIKLLSYKLIKCRFLNVFTKKGLRISRQLIYKKVGKKTT
jgi:ribosomal protein L6P/L9E